MLGAATRAPHTRRAVLGKQCEVRCMPTLEERVTELERQMAEMNRYIAGNDPRPRSERPLEPTLIEQIEDLLDARFAAYDRRLSGILDARFDDFERRMDQRFAECERRSEERFNALSKTIEELLNMQKAEIISELKD